MNLQLTLALRYLRGRKLRTLLTTLAIMFGVLVIFGMNSMMPGLMQAFQANAMAAAQEYDATITSKTGEAFSEEVIDQVKAIPGVRVASEVLERPIGLPVDYFDQDSNVPDRASAVTILGVRPDAARATSAFIIVSGRFLEAGDTHAAVVSESLAEIAGLQLGGVLHLPTPTGETGLEIMGILPQRLLPGNEEVYITLDNAQALFAMPAQINTIRANFDSLDADTRQTIERNIQAALGSSFVIGVLQYNTELMSNMQIAQMVFNLLGALGLLMGAFIIFNTFRTIVAERRRDIGMLRSIGAEQSTIAGVILFEGLIQGVLGTGAGLVLGYLFARLMVWSITPILRQFINIQVPTISVQPGLVLVSIVAGVGITLLAGLLPARAASKISPLEALRPSVGALTLKRMAGWSFWIGVVMIALAALALFTGNLGLVGLGSLLFITGLLLVSPALVNPIARLFASLLALLFARDGTASLAQNNLSRQPSRAAITASTTMIALAILIMAASLISSIKLSFSNMLRESLGSDYCCCRHPSPPGA
jgi:putative ABC transport system permease protein